ncbi:hypothetical protein HK101_008843 [Irineochytrium annulatum]|nr:hypothetical protein HK101_008843 [Irineochytrium annulatum]
MAMKFSLGAGHQSGRKALVALSLLMMAYWIFISTRMTVLTVENEVESVSDTSWEAVNPDGSAASDGHHAVVAGGEKGAAVWSVPRRKAEGDPCAKEVPAAGKVGQGQPGNGSLVLVTGGAGFIGSNLVDRLLSLGYRVRVFDSLVTGSIRNVPLNHPHVEFRMDDIMDPMALSAAMEGVEYVYHMAAMSKVAPSMKSPAMAKFCTEVNALGSWNVLEAARLAGVKKVVYAASSTYYGNNPPPHTETDAPSFLTPYAASKYEGEIQMQMFNDIFTVPTGDNSLNLQPKLILDFSVSIRFFMVYGPRQPSTGAYAIVTGVFARQAALKQPLTIEGTGEHSRDFIHVQDIVESLIIAQQDEKLRGEVINVGTGTSYTVKQVADLVSSDQVHIKARPNDLEATLANTCKMKRVLGYLPKKKFLKEMAYMAEATMKGKIFQQEWLDARLRISAPWVMPARWPMFPWYGRQNSIEGLVKAVTALEASGLQNTVALFLLDSTHTRFALMNHIYSLVTSGGLSSFIVAAADKSVEACLDMNYPCWNVTELKPLSQGNRREQLTLELLKLGVNVLVGDTNTAYVREAARSYSNVRSADIVINSEAPSNARSIALFESVVRSVGTFREILADGKDKQWKLVGSGSTGSHDADVATVFMNAHPPQSCSTPKRVGDARSGACKTSLALYEPFCHQIHDEKIQVVSEGGLHITLCPWNGLECDVQQNIPTAWTRSGVYENQFEPPSCDATVIELEGAGVEGLEE